MADSQGKSTEGSSESIDVAGVSQSEPAEEATPEERPFTVVGIGSSAGGLAALEEFFSAIPDGGTPDMAFVVVQHLAPDHESMLTELVRRFTAMEVFEVESGMVVRPDCIYVIPPNRDMALLNGALQLLEPAAPRGQRLPIDFFFRSLADDQHERAICIVMSGMGSDGTLGLRAVKSEGGMAMAQNPETTGFNSMPESAIATGLVDFVMAPAEMPAKLIAYAAHEPGGSRTDATSSEPQEDAPRQKVLAILRMQTGHDFSLYKQSTVARRIERRMAVNQILRVEDYVRYLHATPAEGKALFRDLLIGVTSFFRNPEVFTALHDTAITRILASKSPGDVVRVWVPACSTGEEAYSIAILIREQMDELGLSLNVKIFATDIDERAILQARAGAYPAGIAADVSPERLALHFTPEADGSRFRVKKSIRDLLVFSEQSVIKDPPFSRIDLISCRNLLIYMGGVLQKRLVSFFHYALVPGGFLCVGTSESLDGYDQLFAPVDETARIYQRKDDALVPRLSAELMAVTRSAREKAREVATFRSTGSGMSPRELTQMALLKRMDVVAALINARGDILYLHGKMGRYLELSAGSPGLNILKLARDGLRFDLATALRMAATQDGVVTKRGLRIKMNGGYTPTDLTVGSVDVGSNANAESRLYLVMLEDAHAEVDEARLVNSHGAGDSATDTDERVSQLLKELESKEEYLERALDDTQSSNEELQSTNEELQSTNEELETSKEELQSVNEEIVMVNAELQQRVSDLSQANNDIANLLAGTGIGTVFVDNELAIQRFTPDATRVMNLIATDIGRPIGHITSNLVGYESLVADILAVLETLTARDAEVRTGTGEWYLLRIRPYRTAENVIEGVVITFTEITPLKNAQEALVASHSQLRRLAVVLRDANDAMLVYDSAGDIIAWNPRATRMYGWTEDEAMSMNVRDITPEDERETGLAATAKLAQSVAIEPYRTRRVGKDGSEITVTLTATALVDEHGRPYAVATTEREVSDHG